MRRSILGLCLALLAAVPASAGPALTPAASSAATARVPNFLGSTGLMYAPSAYVQGNRDGSVFLAGSGDFFAFGALVGITDRFELGIGGLDPDHGSTDVLLNAKLQVLKESA